MRFRILCDANNNEGCCVSSHNPPVVPEALHADLQSFTLARFISLLRRGRMAAQSEKLSFLESISPWGPSRSTTPKPPNPLGEAERSVDGFGKQQGGDHAVRHRHQLSLRNYPRDCPALNVRWFYAVDVGHRHQYFRDNCSLGLKKLSTHVLIDT